MKLIARWLFVKTHREELLLLSKKIRAHPATHKEASRLIGAIDTLESLGLLKGQW